MKLYIVVFFKLLIVAVLLLIPINEAKEEFVRLGRFRHRVPLKGRSMGDTFDEFDYYISNNEAGWTSASSDCQRMFPDGHIISLHDKEEWNYILEQLDTYGSGYEYWTGGGFDKASKKFLWIHDKQEIPNWAPWAPGFPPKRLHQHLRITIVGEGQFSGKWELAAKSKPLRYICEAPINSGDITTSDPLTTEGLEPSTTTMKEIKETTTMKEMTTVDTTPVEEATTVETSTLMEQSTTMIPGGCKTSEGPPETDRLKFLTKAGKKDYYYSTEKGKTWQEAEEFCNENNLELAELITTYEFDTVKAATFVLKLDNQKFWVGSSALDYIGKKDKPPTYTWKCSNTPINPNFWLKHQPDHHSYTGKKYESCIHFAHISKTQKSGLNDYTCDNDQQYFICQTYSNKVYEPCKTSEGPPETNNFDFLTRAGGKDYYLSKEQATWEEAEQFCNEHNLLLAELVTNYEFDTVIAAVTAIENVKNAWVGSNALDFINEKEAPAAYYWKCSDIKIKQNFWNPKQPDHSGSGRNYESCILISKESSYVGLSDFFCDKSVKFICQTHSDKVYVPCKTRKGPPDTTSLQLLTKIENRDFYYTKEQKTWEEAQNFCNLHSLELAEMDTKEDFDLIVAALAGIGDIQKMEFWVGSSALDHRNIKERPNYYWKCSDEKINQDFFLSNQPDHHKIGVQYESCLNMPRTTSRTGFNDAKCDYLSKFICQT